MNDSNTPHQNGEPEWIAELKAELEAKPFDPSNPQTMRAACEFWWDDYIEIADAQSRRDLTLSEEVKQFLDLTEALAQAGETNGLDSTPLVQFHHDARAFYFKLQGHMPVAGPQVQVLLDRLKFKLASVQPATPATAASLPPPPPTPSTSVAPVVLNGRGKPPTVQGKPKPVLTDPQYDVLEALLAAGEGGLNKDELERKSGRSDARGILRRLVTKDADWATVIRRGGQTGGRYRIL